MTSCNEAVALTAFFQSLDIIKDTAMIVVEHDYAEITAEIGVP